MKKNLISILSAVLLLGLASCGNNASSAVIQSLDTASNGVSSVVTSSEVSSTITTSEPAKTNHKYDDSYYAISEEDSEEYSDGLNVGGALIDIAVDKEFVTGVESTFSFSFNKNGTSTAVVTSSNEDVIKLVKISETNYKIIPVHEGNAVLHIQDARGLDRYNHVVYVRDAKTQKEMEEYLFTVEYWVSYGGFGDSYKMTFLFDNKVGISGSIQGAKFDDFTATYSLFKETSTEFIYTFDSESQKNSAGLTGFNISKTGDFMYLQYKNGTAAMMFPNDRTFD